MILSVRSHKGGYFGNRNVGGRFALYPFVVHDDLGMEDLLLYFFIEVVGYGPHEHTLREVADLRGRDQRIHLRIS